MTTLTHHPDVDDRPAGAERPHHPADLIVRRPDLYGVCTVADVVADSVLWAA